MMFARALAASKRPSVQLQHLQLCTSTCKESGEGVSIYATVDRAAKLRLFTPRERASANLTDVFTM